jgi:hypothetical protein
MQAGKKLLIGLILSAGSLGASHALARPWGMAGCGLGSLIFNDGNPQISAATTNDSSLNQGFALSSGTSNCYNPKDVAELKEQEDYFVSNLATLSKDIARGEGESVEGAAKIFGCDDVSQVGYTLKSNYREIFSHPGAIAVYDKTVEVLKGNENTAKSCKNLI